MRLTLFPAIDFDYISDRWRVRGYKSHLSSLTPTTIANAGYGGFGWIITPFIHDNSNILITLYKSDVPILSQLIENGEECILLPNGGIVDEYRIVLTKNN